MKKKILLGLLTFVLMLSLVAPCFAANPPVASFSDDFTEMYFNGYTYLRVNDNALYYYGFDLFHYFDYNETTVVYDDKVTYPDDSFMIFNLSESQEQYVEKVEHYNEIDSIVFNINIYYKDGAILDVAFMRSDYVEQYNAMTEGKESFKMFIDLSLYDNNYVKFTKQDMQLGEQTQLYTTDIYDWVDVISYTDDEKLAVNSGMILISDGEYYYLDFSDPKYKDTAYYEFYVYEYDSLYVREINNEEFCTELKTALDEYYDADMNFIYDNETLESASRVLLVIAFVIIPAAAVVTFVILTIKTKESKYKKLYIAISVLGTAEIILFFVIRYLLFK